MKKWLVVLERTTQKKLNPAITKRRLKNIALAAERNESLGFKAKVGRLSDPVSFFDENAKTEMYRYRVNLQIAKPVVRNHETIEEKFRHILGVVTRCANSQKWQVSCGNASSSLRADAVSPMSDLDAAPKVEKRPRFLLPELTAEVQEKYFAGIYERDEQLVELVEAIRTHHDTQGRVANHALLYGQPGACKTKLCERLRDWLNANGSEDGTPWEWVRFIDGTTVTKAGAENWFKSLAESDDQPAVLVLDEIEKQDKAWLLGLLSVMGSGLVTKMNAFTGNFRARFSPFIVGICNDEESLREFKGSALWSRFTHEIYCQRPTRDLAGMILRDMASEFPNYDLRWAEAALAFGWDQLGQRDIRKIKGHLDGRQRLLDGSWQKSRLRLLEIERREKEAIQREKMSREATMGVQNGSQVHPVSV